MLKIVIAMIGASKSEVLFPPPHFTLNFKMRSSNATVFHCSRHFLVIDLHHTLHINRPFAICSFAYNHNTLYNSMNLLGCYFHKQQNNENLC